MPEPTCGPAPSTSAGASQTRGMAASVVLFFCSAALVAVDNRPPFQVVANGWVQTAGVVFAACGLFNLLYLWSANRFRVSLGRLMIVVAFAAVILQGVLIYRRWVMTPRPKLGGRTIVFKSVTRPQVKSTPAAAAP